MKKCNAEIMKEIKLLEGKKQYWIEFEENNSTTSYAVGETPLTSKYNYDDVQKEIEKIDNRVAKLRFLLAQSNVTTIVEGFNITLAEALVYLAQLSAKLNRLNTLGNAQPLTRSEVCSFNGKDTPQYVKTNYDPSKVMAEAEKINEIIPQLQMAIDRTNLTNLIEC